jgi:hypothetical protein
MTSARNDAAFTAKAAVAPAVVTNTPPSADPAVIPSSSTVPARAEALAALPGRTSSGSNARRAGVSSALMIPQTVASKQISGMVSTPDADASA